ncbi:MAG: type II toxin-antitoxin system VapC family toxin [Deltaproteobacteria bacterium]|nr:type II toxin-antitoxin system VapC family toxin [Deltaproteobacteria bacterium]MBW2639156.1 type II toxin-antitoxin system VapC family toxin [Deltaproteobacteria bacterium]MBW2679442.1 type II toxin-antitoxin system VapC family toxin [Deltaproteobacteria bacterium]
MLIVDTDILIDVGRNVNDAINCLQQIEQKFSVAVSSVTQMELIVGCRNKDELHSLEHFIERFYIIRLDEQISDTAIDLLKQYRLSHGLLIADALIAASAIISDLPFVTKNQSDYRFIDNLQLLPYPDPFQ